MASGNNTKEVSVEEASNRGYILTKEQIEELLNILYNESTQLEPDQLTAVADGLSRIKESQGDWTGEMGRLYAGIEERVYAARAADSGSKLDEASERGDSREIRLSPEKKPINLSDDSGN